MNICAFFSCTEIIFFFFSSSRETALPHLKGGSQSPEPEWYVMQIHSKKVVGAIWCPMQTGPAAGGPRRTGDRVREGWAVRSGLLLVHVKKQPIRRIKEEGGITLCCGKQIKAEKIMSLQGKDEQKVLLMEEGWGECRFRLLDAEGDLMTVWVGSFKGRANPWRRGSGFGHTKMPTLPAADPSKNSSPPPWLPLWSRNNSSNIWNV